MATEHTRRHGARNSHLLDALALAPVPDEEPRQRPVLLVWLIAIEIYRDQVITALARPAPGPCWCERQRMHLVLMARQLDLRIAHQVEDDDDTAGGVGDDGLSRVQNAQTGATNDVQQRKVVLQRRHLAIVTNHGVVIWLLHQATLATRGRQLHHVGVRLGHCGLLLHQALRVRAALEPLV